MTIFLTSWFLCGFIATLISRINYKYKVKVWHYITTTLVGCISLVWILSIIFGWSRVESMISGVMEYEI